MKPILGIIVLLALTQKIMAQSLVGKLAPPIEFSLCLNDSTLTQEHFKSKTIVLEFWATWCAPCLAGFPHINELHDQFAGNDIIFVSITRESEKKRVERVLQKRNLKSLHLMDSKSKTTRNFGVFSLPQTFVIGKSGIVLWSGHHKDLTSNLMASLIKSQVPQLTESHASSTVPEYVRETPSSLFVLNVARSQNQFVDGWGVSLTNTEGDSIPYFGLSCSQWSFINFTGVQLAGFTPPRIKTSIQDYNIDLSFKCDTTYKNPKHILLNALSMVNSVEFNLKYVDTVVWVLDTFDEAKLQKAISQMPRKNIGVNAAEFILNNQSILEVCRFFEIRFKTIFVPGSDNNNRYDLLLANPGNDLEALNTTLHSYGLQLKREKRTVSFFEIIKK